MQSDRLHRRSHRPLPREMDALELGSLELSHHLVSHRAFFHEVGGLTAEFARLVLVPGLAACTRGGRLAHGGAWWPG